MSSRHKLQDPTGILLAVPIVGAVMATGTSVPSNGAGGYAPGCLFIDNDAAGGLQLWINEGSVTSAAFKAVASTASGTVAALTATAATITTATITTGNITTANITTLSVTNETDTPGGSTAAAGTSTTDAGVLPAGTAKVYPTTGADDTAGVRVSATDKVTGRLIMIGNGVSNKILKVYAPSGGTINGGSADAAFSSVSGKGVLVYCLSGSGNTFLAW